MKTCREERVMVRKTPALIRLVVAVGYAAALSPAAIGQGPGTNPKLSTELADLAHFVPQRKAPLPPGEKVLPLEGFSVEKLPKSVQDAVHAGIMQINDKAEVQVYIETTGTIYGEQLTQLSSLGVTPQRILPAAVPTVQALLPITMINQAAMLPFVRYIRLPDHASIDQGRGATGESLGRSRRADAAAPSAVSQAPKILSQQSAELSEEARRAKVCGTVLLNLIVGPDGTPTNVKVERSLGYGLDENAVRAVRTWRFQPGTKDGQPVAVSAQVEVNYHTIGCKPQEVQSPGAPVLIKGGIGPVTFLRFSPHGDELARVSMFGPVALFDTTSYRKARTFPIGMRMVAYSPDGTKIATAEGRDGARVWDAAIRGKPTKRSGLGADEIYLLDTPLQVLQAPSAELSQKLAVTWAEFSPDGKRLITIHSDGPVKVWDTTSWAVEEEIHLTDTMVRAAAFASDSKTIVMGDTSGTLQEWDVATKGWIDKWNTPAGSGVITGVVFSPDGKTLVTTHQAASGSPMVMLWHNNSPARAGDGRYAPVEWSVVADGREWRAAGGWIAQLESGFGSAAFSKDGKLLALGGRNIRLIERARKQIRDIELPEMTRGQVSGEQENQPSAKEKFGCVVTALAFSPDGSALAAGCSEGTVWVVKMTP